MDDASGHMVLSSSLTSELNLGDGNFTKQGLANCKVSSLQRLQLSGKQFAGDWLKNWQTELYDLDLNGSSFSDADVFHLCQEQLKISYLGLANTKISDNSLPTLEKLPCSYLDLSNTKITGPGLLASRLSFVQELRLAVGQFSAAEMKQLKKKYTIVLGELPNRAFE